MKEFNIPIALMLAKLSEIAYDNTEIKTDLNKLKFNLVKRLGNINGISGYICKCKEYSVLVFQGTDPKEAMTILADLKFWRTRDTKVGWATGFYDAYNKLYVEFQEYVADCKQPLYITGHSLGGAIANITALKYGEAIFEACYTFGAPRVCGRKGRKLVNGKSIFRVIHENDVVPLLPLLIFGYIHIGEMLYIGKNNNIYKGFKAYVRRTIMLIYPIVRYSFFAIPSYAINHLMNNYIEPLIIADYRQNK